MVGTGLVRARRKGGRGSRVLMAEAKYKAWEAVRAGCERDPWALNQLGKL